MPWNMKSTPLGRLGFCGSVHYLQLGVLWQRRAQRRSRADIPELGEIWCSHPSMCSYHFPFSHGNDKGVMQQHEIFSLSRSQHAIAGVNLPRASYILCLLRMKHSIGTSSQAVSHGSLRWPKPRIPGAPNAAPHDSVRVWGVSSSFCCTAGVTWVC